LLESLEAKKASRFQPPFPASFGLYGSRPPSNKPKPSQHPLHSSARAARKIRSYGVVNSGGVKLSQYQDIEQSGNLKGRWVRHSRNCWRWQWRAQRTQSRRYSGDHRCRCCLREIMMDLNMDFDSSPRRVPIWAPVR